MAENAHTLDDLRQMQAYPLDIKVGLTRNRIHGWIRQHPSFVSFSGGKDSTVLLHIARQVDPHIPAVFLNTRTEHRSLCEVVRATDNVTTIFPDINFAEAVEQCGWCVPYKDVAHKIHYAREGKQWALAFMEGRGPDEGSSSYRARVYQPYAYLLNAPFMISDFCCDKLKKKPLDGYSQENYLKQIIGTTAEESMNRRKSWLQHGCNAWNAKHPMSRPLSFWTEQDVLQYIRQHDLPLASVYGEIVERDGRLRCTGVNRTGCTPCPIGALRYSKTQLSKFELLARNDPMYHTGLMRSKMGLREVLLWIHAPLGCTACGGRCYCGADPNAPRWSGECKHQLALPLESSNE